MKEIMIMQLYINRRVVFNWQAFAGSGREIVDLKNNRKLVGMLWRGERKPRKKDKAKHVWVKQTASGSIRVAPGVECHWLPLTCRT